MMTTLIFNYYAMLSLGYELKGDEVSPAKETDDGEIEYQLISSYDNSADNVGLLLGMFVTIMFSARISGSHFNPIITVSYMFGNVKQGKFDRILGFLYIGAQFAGAFLGCIFSSFFNSGKQGDIVIGVEGGDMIQMLILEILGSFFLVFMYLSSTEEKTKFTKDGAV